MLGYLQEWTRSWETSQKGLGVVLPESAEAVVLALHATTPVLRHRNIGYVTSQSGWRPEATDAEESDAPVVRELMRTGLLMSQRALSPATEVSEDRWQPASSSISLPAQRRLLRSLVLDARFDAHTGRFIITPEELGRRAFRDGLKPSTVPSELSRLRGQLGIKDAVISRDGSLSLNPLVLRVDWFEVQAAVETADRIRDHYQRAHALFFAEDAWARSARLTPDDDIGDLYERLDAARKADAVDGATVEQQRLLGYVRRTVTRRWELRSRYLDALALIGHTDRQVMEYRLWREAYASPAPDSDLRKDSVGQDHFFGFDEVMFNDSRHAVDPLEFLGSREVQIGTAQRTLQQWADKRKSATPPKERTIEDEIVDRANRCRVHQKNSIDIPWHDMSQLALNILDSLASKVGQSPPVLPTYDVIVAVGRHGALLAITLADALAVRLVGTLAMSRYIDQNHRSTSAYIRGVELPIVNARRVLLCDDVVKSSRTITMARNVVHSAYPAARIDAAAFIVQSNGDASLEDVAAGARCDLTQPEQTPPWLRINWAPLPRTEH